MSMVRRQPWLDRLVTLADDQFTLPGTNIRFGLDAIVGFLMPEFGDGITALLGGIVLLVAWKDGAPPLLLARMAGNLTLDVVVGLVPILGDLVDVAYRANRRNHTLLRSFQRERYGVVATGNETSGGFPLVAHNPTPSWLLGVVLVTVVIGLVALPIGFLFLIAQWIMS
jgi:Domain of unknown function (DUF4112)